VNREHVKVPRHLVSALLPVQAHRIMLDGIVLNIGAARRDQDNRHHARVPDVPHAR
jgi:hypothetical protein